MSEDATLDAFENGESESSERPERVAPSLVTSSYREGATCSACGESAPRRWTDGDGRVCAACAPWTTGSEACDQ